jgi:universal stress protein E
MEAAVNTRFAAASSGGIMYGVHKVLVGVDLVSPEGPGTGYELPPPTLQAVELALRIGTAAGVEVLFLTVMPEDRDVPGNPLATAQLDLLLDEARQRGVKADSKIVVGNAWEEIIREVLRGGHELVLVGSRHHRLRERLLGTTGTKLLRNCPCPVWVARPETTAGVPLVMVADDLTAVGEHAVQLGVAAARLLDARLMVLHAVQYPLEASLRRSGCPDDEIDEHKLQEQDRARTVIQAHLDPTDHRTLTGGVVIEIIGGVPDLVIQDVVEENGVDLLVMGTIARTGIPGLLVGNTAERLLPQVGCSILAVKPAGFETPVKLQ